MNLLAELELLIARYNGAVGEGYELIADGTNLKEGDEVWHYSEREWVPALNKVAQPPLKYRRKL